MYQHREEMVEGFSKKYGIKLLVYFELCDDMVSAIAREKALKGITRAKKFALIEAANPDWEDLVMKLELLKRRARKPSATFFHERMLHDKKIQTHHLG